MCVFIHTLTHANIHALIYINVRTYVGKNGLIISTIILGSTLKPYFSLFKSSIYLSIYLSVCQHIYLSCKLFIACTGC